ncbi:MAG: branched-chain amino acid transport [Nocardioidaceae bacterium]|nr:branched-chain amino acid transport [Nocardioidaceae bacterium]
MTSLWWAITLTVATCYGWKFAGLSVPEKVLEHRLTVRAAGLIPVGLLGALIAVQVFAGDHRVVFDARAAALVVAVGLLVVRAPFLVVVFGAAGAAALIRLV